MKKYKGINYCLEVITSMNERYDWSYMTTSVVILKTLMEMYDPCLNATLVLENFVHPPYSPIMSARDFYLFQTLKNKEILTPMKR